MKKIIALLLVVMALFALVSCSSIPNDPIELGKQIVKNCGDDAYIAIAMDRPNIEDAADSIDVDSEDIYALMEVDYNDWYGTFVFCDTTSCAKDVEEALIEMLEEWQDEDYYDYYDDFIVERSGKVVYIGDEDLFDDIKG